MWLLTMHFFPCRQEIRSSTSSMTSVPKPLKFLRPHYGTLKAHYEKMSEADLKVYCEFGCCPLISITVAQTLISFFMQKYLADILSVLALTMSAEGERVCLHVLWFKFVLLYFPVIGMLCKGVLSLHLCSCHPYISPLLSY